MRESAAAAPGFPGSNRTSRQSRRHLAPGGASAKTHRRSALLVEIPRTAAAWSPVNPPKYRNSTSLALIGSSSARRIAAAGRPDRRRFSGAIGASASRSSAADRRHVCDSVCGEQASTRMRRWPAGRGRSVPGRPNLAVADRSRVASTPRGPEPWTSGSGRAIPRTSGLPLISAVRHTRRGAGRRRPAGPGHGRIVCGSRRSCSPRITLRVAICHSDLVNWRLRVLVGNLVAGHIDAGVNLYRSTQAIRGVELGARWESALTGSAHVHARLPINNQSPEHFPVAQPGRRARPTDSQSIIRKMRRRCPMLVLPRST